MSYLTLILFDLTTTAVTAEETNNHGFLYGLVIAFLAIFAFGAIKAYKPYKGSIYSYLYDNFLMDYYYNVSIRKDASKSSKLKEVIGEHRLVFSNIGNSQNQLIGKVFVVIHTKGLTIVSYLKSSGEVHGNDNKWYVQREVDGTIKNFRLECPVTYLKEFEKHVKEVTGVDKVESYIAMNSECDLSHVHCSIPAVHFEDIIDCIKETDCGYSLNAIEIEDLFVKLGGKNNN